ncbi:MULTISPECIES: hypothetical protein [Cysteiniphilum]|uniref:Uncharacterized protein n=1 Tax=Cysteiniphilum litorale TaxID=2056700 RepID=A0A8J2Z5Y4_9GAMM|nr:MULTISPECIES: hypothetical protein [Cysteiniphilum]GGG03718.1 hypothetical protein GCM10010995_21430 [Cysteiniphilum litorale]
MKHKKHVIPIKKHLFIFVLLFTETQMALAINTGESVNKDIDITARYNMDPEVGMRLWVNGIVSNDNTIDCGKWDNTLVSGSHRSFCSTVAISGDGTAAGYQTTNAYINKTALEIYDTRGLGGIKNFDLNVTITTFDGIGSNLSKVHIPSHFMTVQDATGVIVNTSNTYDTTLDNTNIPYRIQTGYYTVFQESKTATKAFNFQNLATTTNQSAYIPFGMYGFAYDGTLSTAAFETKYTGYYSAKITFTLSNDSWNGL